MLEDPFPFLDDRMRAIVIVLTWEGHWEAHVEWHR